MRLDSERREHGFFWLPDSPQSKVPGLFLVSTSAEVEVELNGPVGAVFQGFVSKRSEIPVIHGALSSGSEVTLLDNRVLATSISTVGIATAKITCQKALLGGHLFGRDSELFESIELKVQRLREWISIPAVDVTYDRNLNEGKATLLVLPALSHFVDPVGTLQVKFSISAPVGKQVGDVTLRQGVTIKFIPKRPAALDEATRFVHRLNSFFCFMMDSSAGLESAVLTLVGKDDQDTVSSASGSERINLIYQSLPEGTAEEKWRRESALLRFEDIGDRFGELLAGWLSAFDRIEPTLGLYFSVKNEGQEYLESRFLALSQALESLHRRTTDEREMSEDEFEALVANIVNACPESKQKWLKDRLAFANEISLRRRMRALLTESLPIFRNEIRVKSVVSVIVNTRNYLTHYTESLKPLAATGVHLWQLCEILEGLLQFHLLRYLGMSVEDMRRLIGSSSHLMKRLSYATE